jgi:hypothetical protein
MRTELVHQAHYCLEMLSWAVCLFHRLPVASINSFSRWLELCAVLAQRWVLFGLVRGMKPASGCG